MRKAESPVLRDPARLAAIRTLDLLDHRPEECFDRLTRLAARTLRAPVALLSVVTDDRLIFKSLVGLPEPWRSLREMPSRGTFCQHAVATRAPLVVGDARLDPIAAENVVAAEMGIGAYAGVPLITLDGFEIATLCVIDREPRTWSATDMEILTDIAAALMEQIDMRGAVAELERERQERSALLDTLQRSEQRYRSLFDGVPVGVYRSLPDGRFLDVSAGMVQMLGYPDRESLLAVNVADLYVSPAERLRWREYVEQHGVAHNFDKQNRRYDGSLIWVCDSGRAVKDDDGRVLYYEGTLEDITELKLAEQELRESSELHLLLFQCSPLPMWVFETATNRFLAVNDAAVDHYGYSREEFLQMTILQIRPEEEVQALLSYSATARDGYDRAGIWRHRKKDGAYINVEIFCHEVNFAGMPAKLVLASDVTERLRAAAKLKESEERYRLLARASRDAIWDWNVVTGKVTWNEALRTVFGYPPESVGPGIEQAYLWWKNHIHPPDRERAAANFHAAVNGGAGEWYCEYRFRRLDGSCVLVSDRGYIGRNEKGEPARMIGSLLDLTSRTRSGSPAKPRQPIDLPPVPPTADATLVAWLTAGNERALEELCKRYGNVVSTLAESILKDPADAEELVTDVFQHVWRLGDRYDAARGTVLAWLLTITRRRAIDRLRTRERRKQILGGAAAAGMASSAPSAQTEPDGADGGAGLVVEQQLARLPDSQRLVLELAYFRGLSQREIARELAEPLGTVKTRMRAGIRKLRRALHAHPTPLSGTRG